MTYSTHAIDERKIGNSPADYTARSTRRRRHSFTASRSIGGTKIIGFGF